MRQLRAIIHGELLSAWRVRRTHEALVNSALVLAGFLYVGQQSIVAGLDAFVRSSASERVAIVLADGSRSETESRLSEQTRRALAGLVGEQDREGSVGDVLEEIVVSTQTTIADQDLELPLRGADWLAATGMLAPELRAGRLPLAGAREIAIGAAVARTLGINPGQTVELSGLDWSVVGLLADDDRYGHDAITSLRAMQSNFGYGPDIQSIRVELPDTESVDQLSARVLLSEVSRVSVRTESEYLENLSRGSRDLVARFGEILVIFIACLAVGVYAVGQATLAGLRSSDWATYRAVGYRSSVVLVAMIVYAAVAGLAAGAAGAALGWAWFDGRTINGFFGDADVVIVQHVALAAAGRAAVYMSIVSAITVLLALLPTWRTGVARHLRIAGPLN